MLNKKSVSAVVAIAPKTTEREQFAERLRKAITNAGCAEPGSPTRLAREFNARYGGAAVTTHAARKWLVGEAIPTQDKLRLLAEWLGVTPDWLRFGGEPGEAAKPATAINVGTLCILDDLRRLPLRDQMLVRQMASMLVKLNAAELKVAA